MLHTVWGPGMELREEELLRREQQGKGIPECTEIG